MMKYNLDILPLLVLVAGLVTVLLGVFIPGNQSMIVLGCLLVATGAGWRYRNRHRDTKSGRSTD